MPSLLRKNVAVLALLCGAMLAAGKAAAEVNFKGKTIDVILGSAAGGGTDGTTRLVGSFLEKHLPGNPSMRYRNVPGGHGAKALNYFMKVKPDGLTFSFVRGGGPQTQSFRVLNAGSGSLNFQPATPPCRSLTGIGSSRAERG